LSLWRSEWSLQVGDPVLTEPGPTDRKSVRITVDPQDFHSVLQKCRSVPSIAQSRINNPPRSSRSGENRVEQDWHMKGRAQIGHSRLRLAETEHPAWSTGCGVVSGERG
jgi:hypothetical protein